MRRGNCPKNKAHVVTASCPSKIVHNIERISVHEFANGMPPLLFVVTEKSTAWGLEF